jgi:hypothetical protein
MVTGLDNTTPTATHHLMTDAPAGMTVWPQDRSLAWSTSIDAAGGCGQDGVWCHWMTVVAADGCPGALYVVVAVLDMSGNVIGHADDVVEALAAGIPTDLRFGSTSSRAATTRPWAMDCF